MTLTDVMSQLQAAAHEGTKKRYTKNQEPQPFFGVPMGVFTRLAKSLKGQEALIPDLWQTGNLDAQVLATYMMDPKKVDPDLVLSLLEREGVSIIVLDKLMDKVIAKLPEPVTWLSWFEASPRLDHQRLYWSLVARQAINQSMEKEEAQAYLDVIFDQLGQTEEPVKWSMNRAQVEIALAYPDLKDQVLANAPLIGAYRDMKVSKGCTSAYAPEWIAAIEKRDQK